jgi:hypothetical protein
MFQCAEQVNSTFFCKQGKLAMHTSVRLNSVNAAEALKTSTMCKWYDSFKNGQESLEDMECMGRPAASRRYKTVVKVQACGITLVCEQLNQTGISYGLVEKARKLVK